MLDEQRTMPAGIFFGWDQCFESSSVSTFSKFALTLFVQWQLWHVSEKKLMPYIAKNSLLQ